LDASELDRQFVDESQFELEEYESDAEKISSAARSTETDGLSASTLALLKRFQGHSATQSKFSEEADDDEIKIFYCSRTHSQLAQFAHELKRVKLPPSLPKDHPMLKALDHPTHDVPLQEGIKHLSLGSRKALCINSDVSKLGNVTAINERCLELQQPGIAVDKKCPYLPSKENEAVALDFRDQALATVRDIEDLGRVGKHLGICPYYASRSVTKHSEVRQFSSFTCALAEGL
jgi:chromosome transmission fidelity protein 1